MRGSRNWRAASHCNERFLRPQLRCGHRRGRGDRRGHGGPAPQATVVRPGARGARRRPLCGGAAAREFRDVPPALEGIKINDRWVVIYSRYDIGCALEKHQSTDCLGHDHASALALGQAAVLYALKR